MTDYIVSYISYWLNTVSMTYPMMNDFSPDKLVILSDIG